MPGLKRTSVVLSDEEEQSDAPSLSSTGSKRARLTHDAWDGPSTSGRHTNGHRPVQNGSRHEEDEPGEETFQPGSIVRVKLTNFVTYTAAEFHPGPSLNMVIGPNGTGKSTLVCAICLGLGWSAENLGRAKQIGEFVKHGNTEAEIEIELAAAPNQRKNPIIRRQIKKQGNKSIFTINGKAMTQKQVVAFAKTFSIQIDNLCQFLPQDRVVEFSRLTPIEMLRETLRAAAPEQMVVWHEELKELRAEEKRLELEQSKEEGHLRQLQAKQTATREDVERHNERLRHQMRFNALEKSRPLIKSNLLKKAIEENKAEKEAARLELRQLEADVAPVRQAQEEMESYRDQVRAARDQRKTLVATAKQQADKLSAEFKAGQSTITEYANQVDAEREGNKKRQQEVKRFEGVIANIDRAMQEAPVEVDQESFNDTMAELGANYSAAQRRVQDTTTEMRDLVAQANDAKRTLQGFVDARAALDTDSGKQANILEKVSKDTATGWNWIQRNRDQLDLEGEVYGPPILTCSVEDPRFAEMVENHLGGLTDAMAITCTNGRDAQLISRKLLGEQNLHQIAIRTVPRELAFYRNPLTRDELQDLGFEGWALDYIQGPDPVLAMLCDSAQLHRAAYTPNQLSEEQHKAVERSVISIWISGREKYKVTKRYGQTSTRVNPLNRSRFFTDQPVDNEKKRELDDTIRETNDRLQDLKRRHAALKTECQEENQKSNEAKTERENLKDEHRRKQKARAEWELLPNKKAEKQAELDSLLQIVRDTGNRVLDIKTKSEKAALHIASLAIAYTKAVSQLRQTHENLVEAEIRLVEADSEVESLNADNSNLLRALQAKQDALRQIDNERKRLRDEYNKIARNLNTVLQSLSEEEKEIMREASALGSVDDLENEISAVRSRLELMAEGNPNAIRAFENREREIEETQGKLEEIGAQQDSTKSSIQEIREQWEPQLDELIERISEAFSHNFEQINCAGQVGVYKDEDFENWSIQIQVKFREHESLSILDSQRQSGGERAVSTVFYLMALQDLARSPFRVVDEINQGMDPRNERKVHERMVDIACRERTSQYFLITPKLLSDLKFHPKMKIHCIASGEHMPDQYDKLDFRKLADLALRRRLGSVAA